MTARPNVIRIGATLYRLDLRGKPFRNILETVSNGKKSLEFHSRASADRKADEIETLLAQYGSKKLETLEATLRIDPLELKARLEPFGKTVQDAVNFYVKHLTEQRDKESSQTLGVLMDEWLKEKRRRVEEKTLRQTTYETLHYKANGKGGYKEQWGSRPVATITTAEIRNWVENLMVRIGRKGRYGFKHASQVSKIHQLSYLSQFFIWCRKRHGTPKENPCEPITVERDEEAGEVNYFTPEEATKIMELSTTKRFISLLPYNAICMFSGVRSAECERLTWENIDFQDGTIIILKADAKTFGRRPVMQPNLISWLRWFKEKCPQYPLIPTRGLDDKRRQFRKRLGIPWAKNGLRHSAASYTLGAKIGDFGYLEQHFGNSRQMLQQHYLNYPAKEVSLRFWNITAAGLTETT